jgi:TRAP-type C4-dicarboxylate transport system permease small subunit
MKVELSSKHYKMILAVCYSLFFGLTLIAGYTVLTSNYDIETLDFRLKVLALLAMFSLVFPLFFRKKPS